MQKYLTVLGEMREAMQHCHTSQEVYEISNIWLEELETQLEQYKIYLQDVFDEADSAYVDLEHQLGLNISYVERTIGMVLEIRGEIVSGLNFRDS
jgi:hypothetical protein